MSSAKLKVLMIADQCNPDWASVPLVAFNFYKEVSQLADITLVTHARNRAGFELHGYHDNIIYIEESEFAKQYYRVVSALTTRGGTNWPLHLALTYPIYAEFDRIVYRMFKRDVKQGQYDLVHSITPMMPRYPVSMVKACKNTPFLLGPVNGGVPFPKGFQATAKKEKTFWNILKPFGRYLLPGYISTYKNADRILSGSTYTLEMLKKLFSLSDRQIELFFENGIPQSFFEQNEAKRLMNNRVELLFVGRLVPYKGADFVVDAIAQLPPKLQHKIHLTIVGDGSERGALEAQIAALNLQQTITLTGWVKQQETREYYQTADIFCFPSVREFGGAVVMEAMACGVPCIVVNNGGVAEYVTEGTGFKIEPVSRDYVVKEMTEKLQLLIENGELRRQMSQKAVERAREFEWSVKGKQMVDLYHRMVMERETPIKRPASLPAEA